MILNFVSLIVMSAFIALFGWLAHRAWNAQRRWLRWSGTLIAGLFCLMFTAIVAISGLGLYQLNRIYSNPVANIKVQLTPSKVALGERRAQICAGCHSTTGRLPLDGGKENLGDEAPISVGQLWAPNLTPGGRLKEWTDGEIIRAIREGISKDGRALIIMPSQIFHEMSDEDAQAIVAYLRATPAVQRDLPAKDLNLFAALLINLFGTSAQPPIMQPIVAPPHGSSDFGRYLTSVSGCRDCHGEQLTGGAAADNVPAPNLTVIVPKWSAAEFAQTLRTGVDPTGHQINGDAMPWPQFAKAFDDEELKALYDYLHALTPLVQAGR